MKLTSIEKKWIWYDIGNSAFVLLMATIVPIYFKGAIAGHMNADDSTAIYSYALSLSTLLVAILGPIFGTMADFKGYKKPLFAIFMGLGVAGTAALAYPSPVVVFLGIIVAAKVGLHGSNIFYDAMLVDVTDDERMNRVSSLGYAWGYIGSCIPFVVSLVLVLFYDKIGITMTFAMMVAFLLNAAWWLCCTIPLLLSYKQKHSLPRGKSPFLDSFKRLARIFGEMRTQPAIFIFLLAFFFYIDGVYTIIEMATVYGSDMGIDSNGLLGALLVTQIVAFPSSIVFGRLASKIASTKLIPICIAAYTGIALFALGLDQVWEFYFLAICVGLFQGGVQALSRSHFASIIPKEKSAEYFGIFDIFGKGATFTGTLLMGTSTQIFGTSKAGVAAIAVMLVLGLLIFMVHTKILKKVK
ncbi:MAG: MFS transporter [Clostridia bacterium]|nr:MFS transporter [Clostridia bacterium]